jgi:hypothetical protein
VGAWRRVAAGMRRTRRLGERGRRRWGRATATLHFSAWRAVAQRWYLKYVLIYDI